MRTFANPTRKRNQTRVAPASSPTLWRRVSSHSLRRAEIHNILHGPRLQAKLTVGAANDAYEREADRVADAVMRMPEPDERGQRICPDCEEEVRRQPAEEEELHSQSEEKGIIQRQEEEPVLPGEGTTEETGGEGETVQPAPLTFNVSDTDLEPKRWADRGNVTAGAEATRTDITIGGPRNSTIDVTHVRQAAPTFGHTHTDGPLGAMARRFKHGHLTNRAGGQGRVFNDFQIDGEGNNRTITYHAPHAAGQVLLTAQVRGLTDAAARREVSVTTQVTGLQEYATAHPNEILIGQVRTHGTNHWGTAQAITRMHNIVNDFRASWVRAAPRGTARNPNDAPTIRINDFSLEHGGVYDLRDNWRNPHKTHRFGNDIDISRTVLINGAARYLRPGNDQIGEIYRILNAAIEVEPEDANHWHVDV